MSEDHPLWKSSQVVGSSQTQISTSSPPENALHQSMFTPEEEMASWFHCPLRQGNFCSGDITSATASHPQSSISVPPPSAPPSLLTRRLRENIVVEARPWLPVRSSGTSFSLVADSSPAPGMQSVGVLIGGVSRTFACLNPVGTDETVWEIAGTSSSSVVCKAETETIQTQPATETDDKKRKERQETIVETEETEEAQGSASKKRSRAAEMHNISERRRREKINEKMKALQELIPRCNKTDKASMLDDAIEYVKSLQLQIQMMSMGGGMMPMMYPPNMRPFMPHMGIEMMGMNRPPFIPFPRQAHTGGVGPSYPAPRYPFANVQASDPSRVHLPSQQPCQLQFPDYMDLYSNLAGLQMQSPPPLQNQTPQLNVSQANSSEEYKDLDSQPTG